MTQIEFGTKDVVVLTLHMQSDHAVFALVLSAHFFVPTAGLRGAPKALPGEFTVVLGKSALQGNVGTVRQNGRPVLVFGAYHAGTFGCRNLQRGSGIVAQSLQLSGTVERPGKAATGAGKYAT
ncbi:hypothetical protein [Deinococcus peraridilitoris]|uniref:hypothetical protein n=1 Tax=Deinococcus peraridilitoris TaxID=432329 RepID=UPI00059CB223|nr:hypothetical protein [Deinococcus peraridilitoris]